MSKLPGYLMSCFLCLYAPLCASADFGCRPPVAVPPADITLFGEIHGTNESPALVAEHICVTAETGKSVVVVLEIPVTEQSSIDVYLSSPGKRKDRAELIGQKFWQSDFQDGRSSVAMFDLIDRVRELRAQGAAISIVADDGFQQKDRNSAIAERLVQIRRKDPESAIVALYGNYHTGKVVGTPSNPNDQRVGYRIRDLNPLAVNIDFHAGWAWACTPKCGVNKFGAASSSGDAPRVDRLVNDPEGHDAAVVLPKVTASPPAKAISIDG